MVQETITRLVDDIDGGEASQTVAFSFGSAQYEIDLSDKNVEKMATALKPFIDVSRKTSRGRTSTSTKVAGSAKREDLARVRVWAIKNGHSVSDRGRVPQSVLDAYDAKH